MKTFLNLTTTILCLMSLSGCGGTTTGNPLTVSINFGSYTSVASSPFDFLIDRAHAGVGNLTFCFKRVRFKKEDQDTVDPNGSEDNINFEIGEIVIDAGGTFLGDIAILPGTYKRVEFDLEDNCGTDKSVDLSNDQGNFESDSRITIKFSGSLAIQEGQTVTLNIQPIIDAADSFDGTGDPLKDVLEDATGGL